MGAKTASDVAQLCRQRAIEAGKRFMCRQA